VTGEGSHTVAGRYEALLLDLDGVVYRGARAVPGAAETLDAVRRAGGRVLFLTNNSSRTPDQVADGLGSMGIHASSDEVLTSALATADVLRAEGPAGPREATGRPRTAFVIGERGIRDALAAAGFEVVDGEPPSADLVVVGWDRSVDYPKLRTATLLIQRGARLIATNADPSYPAPDGLWPGAGAILAAVTTATGATPTVVGKPAAPMFRAAVARTGAERPLVVGDRLDTDIAGAAAMGWDSLLVFTGASRPADLLDDVDLPTYAVPDIRSLLDDVPAGRFRPAALDDAERVALLLDASGLSADGVAGRLGSTFVCDAGGTLLATFALLDEGAQGLLRSVAVREDVRGKGLGILATASAAGEARRRGIARLSLFSETAEGFFRALGFRTIPREELDPSIGESAHAREECAASAVAMVRDL
jgi:glycerol-1-phosphatase